MDDSSSQWSAPTSQPPPEGIQVDLVGLSLAITPPVRALMHVLWPVFTSKELLALTTVDLSLTGTVFHPVIP